MVKNKEMSWRTRFAHVTFNYTFVHFVPKNKREWIEELCEFPFLLYKALGFMLGVFFVIYPEHYLWIVLALLLWLSFDLKLEIAEKKEGLSGEAD